ncbi:MAG: SipW-dependent-type signal peptide-containing protein [Clostridia bacterium]
MALLVVGIVGASLAYFTDKDKAENTFTVGKVKIGLNEQQRNADGTALKKFIENNEALNPIVGSAQGEKDEFGMPTAKNYVRQDGNNLPIQAARMLISEHTLRSHRHLMMEKKLLMQALMYFISTLETR